VKLGFESTAPDDTDMLAVGKVLETQSNEVDARFLPVAGKPFSGTPAKSVDNRDPVILWPQFSMLTPDARAKLERMMDEQKRHPDMRPPAISLAEQAYFHEQRHQFATAATELEIDVRRDRPVILETGSLGAPIAALDKCSRDSLKDWGVDPNLQDKIVRPVWPINANAWLFSSDYPPDMVSQGKGSQVNVRLIVDASGRVTKCTSLSHYDAPEFNRITCARITDRARFEPAELADGTKVPSYYTRRVIFQLQQ
jgi:TonB family protein